MRPGGYRAYSRLTRRPRMVSWRLPEARWLAAPPGNSGPSARPRSCRSRAAWPRRQPPGQPTGHPELTAPLPAVVTPPMSRLLVLRRWPQKSAARIRSYPPLSNCPTSNGMTGGPRPRQAGHVTSSEGRVTPAAHGATPGLRRRVRRLGVVDQDVQPVEAICRRTGHLRQPDLGRRRGRQALSSNRTWRSLTSALLRRQHSSIVCIGDLRWRALTGSRCSFDAAPSSWGEVPAARSEGEWSCASTVGGCL